jgi:hypothetical protein
VLNIPKIITAVEIVLDKSGRARGAKKLDESRQGDAQAYSTDEQLENVHSVERGPLLQIV